MNKRKTLWKVTIGEYGYDRNGVERRKRKELSLGPTATMTFREAKRKLKPILERANDSAFNPTKNITLEKFTDIWDRDYLKAKKPSTQATMRGHMKRLKERFGSREMRSIEAADIQRLIANMVAETRNGMKRYSPKTVRNLWITIRLIWKAAKKDKYVAEIPEKPDLPRPSTTDPKSYALEDVAKIIVASEGEYTAFYWLTAEAGLRVGESCALTLADVGNASVSVNHSVWNGKVGTPKNGKPRKVAVSPQLSELLSEQVERQRSKGHDNLFSTSTGKPWDANSLRKRKLQPLLEALGMVKAGFHAFRHFNASQLNLLRVPLKTRHDRLGHTLTGSLTLDVYTHVEWGENVKAANLLGEAIQNAVNCVSLTAVQQEGLAGGDQQALMNQQQIGCGGQI